MPWMVLGESVIGTAHRGRNTPCQDAFRFRQFGPDQELLVVAAADGAGSASHSDLGAMRVCDELVQRVETLDPTDLFTRAGMTSLFTDVRAVLVTEAERLGVGLRELACTVLLTVVGPTSAAFAQLGDGAIVTGDGQRYRIRFWPEPVEYANATDFLTDERFAETLRFETTPDPITELALLTDGLQRLALDFTARSPHTPFFYPLFAAVRVTPDAEPLVEPFLAFLDSPQVNERTDDDKTLVIAVRRP